MEFLNDKIAAVVRSHGQDLRISLVNDLIFSDCLDLELFDLLWPRG